jgi:hypothetical protein
MKSIFDKNVRFEVITRINSLNKNSEPLWGKMTVTQMVKHCAICEEYYYGNIKVERSSLGIIVGENAIMGILKDEETGIERNAPTSAQFIVTETNLELETEKTNWKRLIERYETLKSENFTHWFFGEMKKEELGHFIYKHCDHHLRQFGA